MCVSVCVCWGRNPSRQTQVGNCPIKAVTAELIAAGGVQMNIKCYHRVSHAASHSAELWTAESWIRGRSEVNRVPTVRQANKQTHLRVTSPSERLHETERRNHTSSDRQSQTDELNEAGVSHIVLIANKIWSNPENQTDLVAFFSFDWASSLCAKLG